MSNVYIQYESSYGCKDGEHLKFQAKLSDLVDRADGGIGTLVELLVNSGVLSLEDAYEAFKGYADHSGTVERIEKLPY